MQVTLEQLEPCKVALSVEVDPDTLSASLDEAFEEAARRVAVPGFRKGKAPRHILERFIDPDLVRERALNEIIPAFYARALEEKGVEPAGRAEISIEDAEEGQPLRFTATVPTMPEVRLCDYRDIPVRRRTVEVTEADVEGELERVRRRSTRLEDTDADTTAPGLVAIVDVDLFRGERQLKNRSQEDVLVDMDDTVSVPAFSVFIDGMKLRETRDVPIRYPADLRDPVLAGKEITHRITLKALKNKVVPEVTDEFAQALGLEDAAALHAQLRAGLDEAAKDVADREVQDQLVEYVVSRSEVNFPDVLLQDQVNEAIHERSHELEERGFALEQYLEARGTDYATFEREMREDARRRVRTQLVLEKLADTEKVEVTDADVDAEIGRVAARSNATPATVRALLEKQDPSLRRLRVQMLFRKVMDLLMESARVVEA